MSRCGAYVVNTTFFEIICRYDKLLMASQRSLPSLLVSKVKVSTSVLRASGSIDFPSLFYQQHYWLSVPVERSLITYGCVCDCWTEVCKSNWWKSFFVSQGVLPWEERLYFALFASGGRDGVIGRTVAKLLLQCHQNSRAVLYNLLLIQEAFLDARGLLHPSARLRARVV